MITLPKLLSRRLTPALSLAFACLLAVLARPSTTFGEDWPQWRGPNRDGVSQETGLLAEWPTDGPPLMWQTKVVGGGFSSVAVAGGRIYTLGDLDDGSYAVALNEADGKMIWRTRIGDAGGHKKYPGTRCTPTVVGGRVFVLNQHADLACLDAESGRLVWSRNLIGDFGGKMMSGWKYSESPLVDGDRVVVTPGGKDGTLLALDRKSGKQLWRTADWTDPAAYSSIIIATIHGVRQYVQFTGNSVAGVEPESGRMLWKAVRLGKTAVVANPVIGGDIVFVTSSYGVGCNAFRISRDGDNWTAKEIYANKIIANHHGGVVLVDGYIYGSSGNTFRCLELKTGKLMFGERGVGKGATMYADGHFYLRNESGPVVLIAATPDGLREISRFDQPDRSEARAWPHPVIANGKLYLRDQELLLCYDVGKK